MRFRPLCGSLVVGLALAAPLEAQVLQAPPRSSGGQFGTPGAATRPARTFPSPVAAYKEAHTKAECLLKGKGT